MFQFLIGRLIIGIATESVQNSIRFQFLIGRLIIVIPSSTFIIYTSFQFLIGRLIIPAYGTIIEPGTSVFQFLIGRLIILEHLNNTTLLYFCQINKKP